jgi:hypothetical protein
MTQTDSPPANITPGGFFYLFALPPDQPEGVETVFYRLQGWPRAEFVRDTLQQIEANGEVTYSCVPSATFWPTTQEIMRRIVKELEKRYAPDCDECGLPPGDPLFLRAQGFINAQVMARAVQQIPVNAATENPFPAELLGDPLNLLLNELYLYAEHYDRLLQAVAGGHGKKLDMEVDQTYAAVVAGLKFMLGCDDVRDAGLTFAPMVPHIGPASLRKLDWDAVLLDSENFFTRVGRFVRVRGMYEPVTPSFEAYVMAGLRAKAAKNLEQAAAYGRPISNAPEKASDASTSVPQADLLATIKAGFEGVRDDRIKDALHGRTQQAEIEKMAEGASAFLAGLSVKLSARDRELFFLLTGHVKQGLRHRVKTLEELGRALGGITKQAVHSRMQTFYKKYPAVAGYVKSIRKPPGRLLNFSELSPSKRRQLGVDESYN